MMAPSHLAATLLLGLILARWFPFDARAWFLAVAFGVLIDVDHLFQIPRYLADEFSVRGAAALSPAALMGYGAGWQGVFHHPVWGPVLVLVASVLLRSPIPAAFWGLHVFLDFVVARRFVVFGSATEVAVLGAMVALVGVVGWMHHRDFGAGRPLPVWAAGNVASVAAAGWSLLALRR